MNSYFVTKREKNIVEAFRLSFPPTLWESFIDSCKGRYIFFLGGGDGGWGLSDSVSFQGVTHLCPEFLMKIFVMLLPIFLRD